jgi:hypothetical protein
MGGNFGALLGQLCEAITDRDYPHAKDKAGHIALLVGGEARTTRRDEVGRCQDDGRARARGLITKLSRNIK